MQKRPETPLKTATNLVARDGSAGIRRRIPNYANRPKIAEEVNEKSSFFPKLAKVVFCASAFFLFISAGLYFTAEQYGDVVSRGGHSNSTKDFEVVIANNVLNVKENTVRFPKQRRTGVHERMELYLHWPTMSGYSDDLSGAFNNSGAMEELLFLSIEPRSMSFDMSGRLEPIYSLYFNGLAVHDRTGLVRQPLSEAGGFIDEDLFYEPDSPYPYAVRCVREISRIGLPMCMRDIHIGKDLMITYRFNKRFLQDWMHIDQAVRTYTKNLLGNKSLVLAE